MNLHTNLDLTQKKVAETAEIPKTAPKPNPKAEKNTEKSRWNRRNPQNSSPTQPISQKNCVKKKLKLQKIPTSIISYSILAAKRRERESTKLVRIREQARWCRVLGPTLLATTEKSKKNLKNIIDI